MDFSAAIKSGFQNYVGFGGRASRSEFWYWNLFAFLVQIACVTVGSLGGEDGANALSGLASIALFLPGLAMTFRRLHDGERSGWWWLIGFTVIGLIPLVIWFCKRGTAGPNRFGSDPLNAQGEGAVNLAPSTGAPAGSGGGEINKARTSASESDLARLEQLARLRDQGVLTQEEFDAEKKRILNG